MASTSTKSPEHLIKEKTSENNRTYYVLKVADLYKKVDKKVDRLLLLITKLTEKWLQG